jgi:UDPglucose 6-dehydrogenase
MLISVLGTGYLGSTHAACLAACGHTVIGVDSDAERVRRLRQGVAPFHEEGLDALLAAGVGSGRLSFTEDLARVADAEVHFLCVGTPQLDGSRRADLSALWTVAESLAPLLARDCLVVGKSTVPVGTAARLRDRLRSTAPAGEGVSVAWNPEFLREGCAVRDSPELAKVSANAMLAARVSVVNLLAEVCEVSGADVGDLTEILGADRRIGRHFLRPGLGYGGGCLPKDTRAFVARAHELGVRESTALLEAVDAVNMRQRERTTELATSLLGPEGRRLDGRVVAVLGGAFKGGSDDVRDSPALDVADRLNLLGADVRLHDPCAGANVRRTHPRLAVADDVVAACAGAELVLVLTDWKDFAAIDPVALGETVARRAVLDARLVLDRDKWVAAGWEFHALGRGRPARRSGSSA